MDASKILEDRENRSIYICKYIDKYQVVSLKANIPGDNKNIYLAYILINLFSKKISDSFNPIKTIYKDSYDGPYYLFLFNKEVNLKEDMMRIEESPLGRFLDIDCYLNSSISISRTTQRKCMLCDNDARICIRNKTHSYEELISHIESLTHNYLYEIIDRLIDESILGELNLTNKFGLVSPISNGSHKDMNYELMIKAKNSIRPYLLSMFKIALQTNLDIKEVFLKARKIGVEADKAMLKETNGVNCYLGLIFNLGIVLCSLGYSFKHNLTIKDTLKNCSIMVEDLSNNYGAIKEAKSSYESVYNILSKYNLDNNDKLYALMDLIINVDDTILLKRAKNLDINNIKDKFKEALDSKDSQLINQMNDYCVQNNLSFGGCADLLVVGIFLKKVISTFSNMNV